MSEPDVDVFLSHFGVRGMQWGQRKAEISASSAASAPSIKGKGVTIKSDGSMTMEKGASIQRLVRSNGTSLPMKDITYASVHEYDNARYIKTIGGKRFLGDNRDKILHIEAVEKITTPSYKEATRLHSEIMLNNKKFRETNTSITTFGSASKKEMAEIRADPTGKTAQKWYHTTNVKMTFDPEYDSDAPYLQKTLRSAVEAKGYNAIRDENDVKHGLAMSPIVIFAPEKNLKVTSSTMITDELRKANKQKLKEYKSLGKDWLDKEMYDD